MLSRVFRQRHNKAVLIAYRRGCFTVLKHTHKQSADRSHLFITISRDRQSQGGPNTAASKAQAPRSCDLASTLYSSCYCPRRPIATPTDSLEHEHKTCRAWSPAVNDPWKTQRRTASPPWPSPPAAPISCSFPLGTRLPACTTGHPMSPRAFGGTMPLSWTVPCKTIRQASPGGLTGRCACTYAR
jgi:hypothetical protein